MAEYISYAEYMIGAANGSLYGAYHIIFSHHYETLHAAEPHSKFFLKDF
jgi:hypothetical protein